MNFLDCAYDILKKADNPLHYTEITRRALANGILDTKGQTLEATMGSRLYVDTKRSESRFRRVRRGVFRLAETQATGIAQPLMKYFASLTEEEIERLSTETESGKRQAA